MRKVKCTCPSGIQLRLLGGMVYLRPGQEAVLTDVQITHGSVQTAIKQGNLQIIPMIEEKKAPEPVAPVEEKAPEPVAPVEEEKAPEPVKRQRPGKSNRVEE